MVKAVFFDWFNTLAVYHPPREMLQSQAIQENGYFVSIERLRPALVKAEQYVFDENASRPLRLRTMQEQTDIFLEYEKIILSETGIDFSENPNVLLAIYRRAHELSQNSSFALYDDVLPAMKQCRERNLTLGLITNIDIDMKPVCDTLGLAPFLDIIVTSGKARFDKPKPEIFYFALSQAGVTANEAVHVGDQYQTDILGARGAGIRPIMIDRGNLYPGVKDCIRITSLTDLQDYL